MITDDLLCKERYSIFHRHCETYSIKNRCLKIPKTISKFHPYGRQYSLSLRRSSKIIDLFVYIKLYDLKVDVAVNAFYMFQKILIIWPEFPLL